MNSRKLEKRYQGLHYEVGRLPSGVIHSPWYWSLPHDFRQFLYEAYVVMRFRRPGMRRPVNYGNPDYPNFEPFLHTRSIFVHVPKTGGTSVTFGLYGRKTGDHRTIADYKLCFPRHEFHSFFKFSFARNPWDRLLSAYLYMKHGGRNKEDCEWSIKYLRNFHSFHDFVTHWVNEENIRRGLHFRPQYEFLCTTGCEPEVDFIGYYEDLYREYEYIRGKLGAGGKLVPMNRTSRKKGNYRDYYTAKTRAIVEKVYQKDIELFSYSFNGTSTLRRPEARWTRPVSLGPRTDPPSDYV